MPPDAITWLVGTLSVAVMGVIGGIIVAYIRRPVNNAVSKRDFDEFRVEMRRDMAKVDHNVARLADKLDTHVTYHRDG